MAKCLQEMAKITTGPFEFLLHATAHNQSNSQRMGL